MLLLASLKEISFTKPHEDGEQGWSILKFHNDKEGSFTATGVTRTSDLTVGLVYGLSGNFVEDQKYGTQFKFDSCLLQAPIGEDATKAFLTQCRGIGPAKAKELWDLLGEETISVLTTNPLFFEGKVKCLGKTLLIEAGDYLNQKMAEIACLGPIMDLIHGCRFPKQLPAHIVRKFTSGPIEKIKENPYCLLKFPKVSFTSCDSLRQKLGFPRVFQPKYDALFTEIFRRSRSDIWLKASTLVGKAMELCSDSKDEIKTGLFQSLKQEDTNLVAYQQHIALATQAITEKELSKYFAYRAKKKSGAPWPRPNQLFGLSGHQREQCLKAFANGNIAVLAGTAGTGKTYTTSSIIQCFAPSRVLAACPTGKAANRLCETLRANNINEVVPTTIHSMLGAVPYDNGFYFRMNERNKLQNFDLIVIDEIGMLTNEILYAILAAIPDDTLILLVGDHHQLPPIGHGAFLRDWMSFVQENPETETTYGLLEETQRNAGCIVETSQQILKGKALRMPQGFTSWNTTNNLQHVSCSPDKTPQTVVNTLETIRAKFNWNLKTLAQNVQIIVALNEGNHTSKDFLNEHLQKFFNPKMAGDNQKLKIYDKAICLQNYNFRIEQLPDGSVPEEEEGIRIMNGEILTIIESRKDQVVFSSELKPGMKMRAVGNEVQIIDLAYAITCHKSQGSQWPIVFVVTDGSTRERIVADQNWLYTGITRSTDLTLVFGSLSGIKSIAKTINIDKRITFFNTWLKEAYNKQEPSACYDHKSTLLHSQ